MNGSDFKFDEDAFRKKIRKELEREHHQKQEKLQKPDAEKEHAGRNESLAIESFLKEQLEEEVYGRYPEFIKCGNHLNEIRWFTARELEDNYEFYPYEETRFEKLKRKFFKPRFTLPDSPEIRDTLNDYRAELEEDAKRRLEEFRKSVSGDTNNNRDSQQSALMEKLYEEEQDRFYGRLKGYRKYKNHAGETRWLTEEEFENQDEFIDPVLTPKQILLRRTAWIAMILVLAAAVWWGMSLFNGKVQHGYLIIEMEAEEADLYIDQSPAFGFRPNAAYPLIPGRHEIMVLRNGHGSEPRSQSVVIGSRDTLRIGFRFFPEASKETGIVRISSEVRDAGIFVNGEFRGTLGKKHELSLPSGEHTISLQKEGFSADPRQHLITMQAGDTLSVTFRMIPIRDSGSGRDYDITSYGLIEVTSNIKDAEIYLDGRDTGYKTDYILQKIPLGQHIVTVRKDGYIVYPEERTARLTKNEKQDRVHFNLSSTTRQVQIRTVPERGEIYIDGKSAGKGVFSGALPLGTHTITFGELPYYQTPRSQTITVRENGENNYEFVYLNDFRIQFAIGKDIPQDYSASHSQGYILEGIEFRSSDQVGPEIRNNDAVNGRIWILNYAFQYQNPPGSDAVVLRFRIPEDIQFNKTINLKLWIYRTEENYPLTIKGRSLYRIIINKGVYQPSHSPSHSIKDIAEDRFDIFPVNDYLRTGYNTIIISASTEASASVALWKVSIE